MFPQSHASLRRTVQFVPGGLGSRCVGSPGAPFARDVSGWSAMMLDWHTGWNESITSEDDGRGWRPQMPVGPVFVLKSLQSEMLIALFLNIVNDIMVHNY